MDAGGPSAPEASHPGGQKYHRYSSLVACNGLGRGWSLDLLPACLAATKFSAWSQSQLLPTFPGGTLCTSLLSDLQACARNSTKIKVLLATGLLWPGFLGPAASGPGAVATVAACRRGWPCGPPRASRTKVGRSDGPCPCLAPPFCQPSQAPQGFIQALRACAGSLGR
jgi:hypothetical protein